MTWGPSPGWQPLTSGTGQSNGGVWRTPEGWVVKRLVPGVEDPRHHAYWRRQPLLAESRLLEATPGLRAPHLPEGRVGRGWRDHLDSRGLTGHRCRRVARRGPPAADGRSPAAPDPLFLAAALGRFARAPAPEPSWGARDVLRDRLGTVARRGGWAALDPMLSGDLRHVVQELWVRRDAALAELDSLPRVPTHGDAHPGNLIGRDGEDVIAIDWEQFGLGPPASTSATCSSPSTCPSTTSSRRTHQRSKTLAPYAGAPSSQPPTRRSPAPHGPSPSPTGGPPDPAHAAERFGVRGGPPRYAGLRGGRVG